MKAPERRLPVLVGDWPNPAGFVDIGTIAADGIKYANDDCRAVGGYPVKPPPIRTLQDSYSMSITVSLEQFDRALVGAIIGDPLMWLAYEARRINPHWYLEGDQ